MPDWSKEIRAAIATLDIEPTREALVVEELSQHLADRYDELRGNGVEDLEAYRLLKEELKDGRLTAELGSILVEENANETRIPQGLVIRYRIRLCQSKKRPVPSDSSCTYGLLCIPFRP